MERNVIFARTGWMRFYGARAEQGGPEGGGSFNEESEGSERENFKERGGQVFGYAQVPFGAPLNRQRIYGSDATRPTLIVLVAQRGGLGQVVVGWHDDVTCQESIRTQRSGRVYNWVAPAHRAVLLPVEERVWEVPKGRGGMGQSNVLYSRDKLGGPIARPWAEAILRLIENHGSDRDRSTDDTPEELIALEGEAYARMVAHRHRERRLREAKVQQVLAISAGRLRCEVPGCQFDFEQAYGELGRGYAQVHHLEPLSSRAGSRETRLEDLVIVCANCHVMIHRFGECRAMEGLLAMAPKR